MELVGVAFIVKIFLSSVNGISYDYDLGDTIDGAGLVDTTPDCKQFCFSACHKQSMVNGLGERAIRYVLQSMPLGNSMDMGKGMMT